MKGEYKDEKARILWIIVRLYSNTFNRRIMADLDSYSILKKQLEW